MKTCHVIPQVVAICLLIGSGLVRAEVLDPAVPSCGSTDPLQQEEASGALLQAGNNFYAATDFRQAADAWKNAMACSSTSSSWPKAVFNLGLLARQQGNPTGAIAYFQKVIDSKPNDKEPGSSLMQTNRNYTHRSALAISACYESLGDYRNALFYARLAKNRYRYYSWCGTCYGSATSSLNRRIAYLMLRTSQWYLVTVLFVGCAGFTFIGWKRYERILKRQLKTDN